MGWGTHDGHAVASAEVGRRAAWLYAKPHSKINMRLCSGHAGAFEANLTWDARATRIKPSWYPVFIRAVVRRFVSSLVRIWVQALPVSCLYCWCCCFLWPQMEPLGGLHRPGTHPLEAVLTAAWSSSTGLAQYTHLHRRCTSLRTLVLFWCAWLNLVPQCELLGQEL